MTCGDDQPLSRNTIWDHVAREPHCRSDEVARLTEPTKGRYHERRAVTITGSLQHKIVDAVRQRARSPAFASLEEECRIDDFDALFDETGHWENPPADWGGDPESQLSQQQFFEVMQMCLESLPPNTARVFMMREVMELDADEICRELTITSNNLWVILYRARVALRDCAAR